MDIRTMSRTVANEDAVCDPPERRLFAALLLDTIRQARGEGSVVYGRRVMTQMDQAWIDSDAVYCDPVRGVSFLYACEQAGVEPEEIRMFIRRQSAGVSKGLVREFTKPFEMKHELPKSA